MIEAVSAPERTAPGGHDAHPPVLGIDHFLEIKNIVVLGGKVLERTEGSNPVFNNSPITTYPDVLDFGGIFVPLEGGDELEKGFLTLSNASIVEKARFQDV